MKPPLFTDADLAAVDREIEEAAAMAAADLRKHVSSADEDLSNGLFEMELTVQDLLEGIGDDAAAFTAGEVADLAAEGRESCAMPATWFGDDAAHAAIHIAWLVPAVAFALGFATGNPNGDAAWLLAPGLVLAGLCAARMYGKALRGTAEFAFCLYAVSVARMAAAAVASGSLLSPESGMAVAGGLALALCGTAIAAGWSGDRRRQAAPRREPRMEEFANS